MEKYSIISKVLTTATATYYTAEHEPTRKPITVKKLKGTRDWQALLKCPELAVMKNTHNKHLARLVEVIKHKNSFYLIHQDLGSNLQAINGVEKLDWREVVRMARQMVPAVQAVHGIQRVSLEMFFYDGNTLRMSLTPHMDQSVEVGFRYMAPEQLTGKHADKSLVFSIGCILAELLLNTKFIKSQNRKQYVSTINSLFPTQQLQSILVNPQKNAQGANFMELMQSNCNCQPMIDLLTLMLKVNPNERISFEEVLVRLRHIENKLHEKSKPKSSLLDQQFQTNRRSLKFPPLQTAAIQRSFVHLKTEGDVHQLAESIKRNPSFKLHRSLKKWKQAPIVNNYLKSPYASSNKKQYIWTHHRKISQQKPTYYARPQIMQLQTNYKDRFQQQ